MKDLFENHKDSIRRAVVWFGSALCLTLFTFGLISHMGLVDHRPAQWVLSFLTAGFLLAVFAGQPFLWLADRVFGLLPYSRDDARGRRTPEVEKTAARFAGMFLFSTIVVAYNLGEFTVLVAARPWNWCLSTVIALMFLKFEITIFLYFQKSGIWKRLAVVLLVSSFTTVNFGLNILKPDIDDELMSMKGEQAKQIYAEQKAEINRMFDDKKSELEASADKATERARAAALTQAETANNMYAGRLRALTERVGEATNERDEARRRASVAGFIRDAKSIGSVNVKVVAPDSAALARARTERDEALTALGAMSQEELLASQKGTTQSLSGFGARIQAFFVVVTKTFWTSAYFLMMFLVLTAIESLPVLTLGMRTPAYLWYLQCKAPSREELTELALENANLMIRLDRLIPTQVVEAGVLASHFRSELEAIHRYRQYLASVLQQVVDGDITTLSLVRVKLLLQWNGLQSALRELVLCRQMLSRVGNLQTDMFDGQESMFKDALAEAKAERERQQREAEEARRQAELEARSRPMGGRHEETSSPTLDVGMSERPFRRHNT